MTAMKNNVSRLVDYLRRLPRRLTSHHLMVDAPPLNRQAGLPDPAVVFDALHDPFILIGPDRAVLQTNRAARAMLRGPEDGAEAPDLALLLRNPDLLAAVDAVLAGGPERTVEFTQVVPVERVLEARVQPLLLNDRRLILTLRDVTAVRRSDQLRSDFVANASHELRTPLASLIGFIETLRGPARDDTEARDRFLGIMHDQATRMSRLVNDLLSLSRIELDEHMPPTGSPDVAALVRGVSAMLELKAAARKVRLRLELPDKMPLVIGDADQLEQVFQNLIDNAIKYTREQTDVTIKITRLAAESKRSGGMLSICVADCGEGIDRTHLPRLTERFYRVDTARSRAQGGTGLGLAIVKHIVNRHRGRLIIDSVVGQGSRFTVLLPIARETARRGAGRDAVV